MKHEYIVWSDTNVMNIKKNDKIVVYSDYPKSIQKLYPIGTIAEIVSFDDRRKSFVIKIGTAYIDISRGFLQENFLIIK